MRALTALGDPAAAESYGELHEKSRVYLEETLYDGEIFIQKIEWKGMQASNPAEAAANSKIPYSAEAMDLLEKEGPKYQYGSGCLSDGVLGAWIAECIVRGTPALSQLISRPDCTMMAARVRATFSSVVLSSRPQAA